ncbi:PHD-finger [Oesophagostomum dentatum]|uniref:[histone H3]-trimethyl-L-lysine(4) demethylase n=1 Tax=Oesophagostomum dentatum TaxID=61180 RepID=A0A0B1TPH0_OESDE|nr:PHD-finger [Oesophagostomum dentatum]
MTVYSFGGGEVVTTKKQWTQVCRKVNVRSNHGPSCIKTFYMKFIQPFSSLFENAECADIEQVCDNEEKDSKKECIPTMQGRRRQPRPQGRMMAGLTQPRRNKTTPQKKKIDPMESVFCVICRRGDEEDRLLLCEDCDKSMHTHCCNPPLDGVPKGEWRCPTCVAKEVNKIGVSFGFYDAHTSYNLFTFAEYANKFKTEYFNVKEPEDVSDEMVEQEFWRIVNDLEETVSVKYGADLITSKVVRELAPGVTRQKDIFHHMTTAVNPAILLSKGVKIWTVHQNAGEFVITFPRAYHAGYNEGLNFAEAVNFAPIDWLSKGRQCVREYADVRRFCVFSHDELVLKMASSCEKLGIAMSLATLDEMLEISKRESQDRALVTKNGVSLSRRENFETIADDARTCRVKTRIQRADTRLDIAGIRNLIDELANLPCDQHSLIEELEGLISKIEKWQEEARAAIEKSKAENAEGTSSTDLRELAERGEEFDVRLEEIDQLWRTVEMREWSAQAQRILDWTATDNMENDDEYLTRERWNSDEILRLISDGSRLFPSGGPSSPVNILHGRLKAALIAESKIERLFADPSSCETDIEKLWSEIRGSDWLQSKAMDKMRAEVLRLRDVHERTTNKETSLNDCVELIRECEESRFLVNSELHKSLISARDGLLKFTQRLTNLFLKPSSYYNLVEIIRDRDDIAALVEGQIIPRFLLDSSLPEDQWIQLREFSSCTEMKQHLNALREQQRALMGSLQDANSKRTTVDTCVCVSSSGQQSPSEILVCILCRAKYHVTCCEWDPFLDRLPEGAYLCVRCLRGRRPCIEDVQAACNLAPANSLEVILVRDLICRGRELACEAKAVLADIAAVGDELSGELKDRAQSVVESVLACEVLDMDVLPKVAPLIQKTCPTILDSQKRAWASLRERPARSSPMHSIFTRAKRGKRSSGGKYPSKKERKKSRVVYHQDDEMCSADTCLKPYGRFSTFLISFDTFLLHFLFF